MRNHLSIAEAKKRVSELDIEEYEFITNRGCCDACHALDGKHFKVKSMMPGDNAPPLHPNCRCSIAAYEDDDEYEAWLDYLDKGGSTAEWEDHGRNEWLIKNGINNREINQMYRPVTRGESTTFSFMNGERVEVNRIDSYDDPTYVSKKANIKRRDLHKIVRNTEKAMKAFGIPKDRRPNIVILSESEMPNAWGKYDATTNTLYYIPEIANKRINKTLGETELHEIWHLKQAEDFRSRGKIITKDNYGDYIRETLNRSKSNLDKIGINEYNASGISDYAYRMYLSGRYDEVEAEYMAQMEVKHAD